MSSGFQIPTDCWKKDESFPEDILVYKCNVSSVELDDGTNAPHVENLKVLRIGDDVSEPCRYPNLDRDAQYTKVTRGVCRVASPTHASLERLP